MIVFYLGNHLLMSFSFAFIYLHSGKHCRFITCILPSISNKNVLFIFSANKAAADEVPQRVPLEQKVVKDVYRLNSNTYLLN